MRAGIGLHYLDLAHYQGGGGAFEPSSLFGDTDTGGFYDPSDLTSLASGRANVADTLVELGASAGDTIGTILDKSQMGGLTAEAFIESQTDLVPVGASWHLVNTGWTVSTDGKTASFDGSTGATYFAQPTNSLTVGATYILTFDVTAQGGTATIDVITGAYDVKRNLTAGSYSMVFEAAATAVGFRNVNTDTDTITVENIVLKEIPGNHLIAPSDAARPVLRADGELYYLEFDGTDDQMEASSVIGYNDGFTAVVGVATADNTNANQAVICERAAGTSNGFVVYLDTDDIEFWTGNGSTWDIDSSLATLVDDTPVVFTSELTPTGQDKSLRDDGAAASATSGLTVGQSSLEQFRIGSATDAGSFHLEGRLYGTTIIDRLLTTTERQNLEIYLANKSGVTLDSSSTATFPALLYDANTDGGLYDPSDLTSMSVELPSVNDNIHENPSAGDTVGCILDKSQMGGMTAAAFIDGQPEIVTNGTFDSDVSGWSSVSTALSWDSDGYLEATGGGFGGAYQDIASTASYFWVTFRIQMVSGTGINLNFYPSGAFASGIAFFNLTDAEASPGTWFTKTVLVPNEGGAGIRIYAQHNNATLLLDDVSVKEIPGNHLVAPSDAARPILRDEIVDGTDVDVSSASDLVAAGDGDGTDFSNWTAVSSATLTTPGDVFRVTNGAASAGRADYSITVDSGKWFLVELDLKAVSGAVSMTLISYAGARNPEDLTFYTVTVGDNQKFLFRSATDSAQEFSFEVASTTIGHYIEFDNVSVKEVPASADRRYWLDFDGTDDQLEVSFGTSTWLTNTSYVTAFNPGSDTQYILHAEADNTDSAWSVAAQTGDASTTLFYDGSAFSADYFTANGGDSFTYTGGVTDRDDLYTAFLSGTHVITVRQDWTDYDGFGVSNYGPGGWYMDGNWYGTAIADRQLTYSEREELEAYLGRKSGTIDFDTAWHPSSLFENSEDGAVYDVSLASSLFQERTGASATTPAGVGDPVGTILDQSGNGNHAVAPSDAARPLLQRDSNNKLYLDFDGTDDYFDTNYDVASGTTDLLLSASAKRDETSGIRNVLGSRDSTSERAYIATSSSDGFVGWEDATDTSSTFAPSTDKFVFVVQGSDNSFTAYGDGTVSNSGTSTGTPTFTSTTNVYLGTFNDAGTPSTGYWNGRIYGASVIDRELTGTERDRLERWLADKAGINLKQ